MMRKYKNIPENLSWDEASQMYSNNLKHFIQTTAFYDFVKSLGKEDIFVEIIKNLNSENDKKAFISFIEQAKPGFLSKKNDGMGGMVYTYKDRFIWTPENNYDLEKTKTIFENLFQTLTPCYYLIGNQKKEFESFEKSIHDSLKAKKKASYIIKNQKLITEDSTINDRVE